MPRLVMAWQSWTIALALLQVAQFSETARAADDRTCDAYAAEAVAKARLVRDKNCGYDLSNPQWSLDFGAHVRWCLNAESSSVDTERANRELKSDLCEACRAYAISAAATVARAVDQKCLGQISGGCAMEPQ